MTVFGARVTEDGTLVCCLPWPPSANKYWRLGLLKNHKRPMFMLSKDGRAYRRQVRSLMMQLNGARTPIPQPAYVSINAFANDTRKRDLDNLLKPALDALEFAGIVADDSHFDDIRIQRGAVSPGSARLEVSIGHIKLVW